MTGRGVIPPPIMIIWLRSRFSPSPLLINAEDGIGKREEGKEEESMKEKGLESLNRFLLLLYYLPIPPKCGFCFC